MILDAALLRPWRLPPNRVGRFYLGGLLMERFRGAPSPADSNMPEDWVGSATRAWTPPGSPPTDDGLGVAEIDGVRHRIADLLAADPTAVAGAALVDRAGPTLGVLVKLLDAAVRLPVHCHPSRGFARSRLGSFFGKAEAWLVTDARMIPGAGDPGVWIGFRREITRDEILSLIEAQQTEWVLEAMHHRPTGPGDVWFIPPGVPHAIGAGVFMVEIQEPSDFSIVVETRGIPIDAADAHLRLGWDVTIDGVDLAGHDDPWLDGLRHDGRRPPVRGDGWELRPLTDEAADPFFRAERLIVDGDGAFRPRDAATSYYVGVVTGGAGLVRAGSGELAVGRGDTFAVPAAAMADFEIAATEPLELIGCRPPDPSLLDEARG